MHKEDYEMHDVERMYLENAVEIWKAWNAQTGALAVERMCWSAMEIPWHDFKQVARVRDGWTVGLWVRCRARSVMFWIRSPNVECTLS